MTPAEFRTVLLGYTPQDATETEHHRRILQLLETSPDPFSRDSFEPGHITGSAFVVSRTGRKALLLLHKKLNRWLQPGGHLEPGDDSPQAAALREAREETGLERLESRGLFDLDVHPIPARGAEPEHFHFDVRYLLTVGGLLDLTDAETDARWFSAEELAGVDADAGLKRMIAKAQSAGWI